MTIVTAERKLLNEGKTKRIWEYAESPKFVLIESKSDVTAGDGLKHDIIEGKEVLSTTHTCDIFKLLKECRIPVAFEKQVDKTTFLARKGEMIPLEVVARRQSAGSNFPPRMPQYPKGYVFNQLRFELFLKTSDKKWKEYDLLKDDPYMVIVDGGQGANLHVPNQLFEVDKPFLMLDDFPLKDKPAILTEIERITRMVFLILEKAFDLQGAKLIDFKLEFAFDQDGKLMLADVIDAESCRLEYDGVDISKESYRQGAKLDAVLLKYMKFAELTSKFRLPKQQIVVWRGSDKDPAEPFLKGFDPYVTCGVSLATNNVCSWHKEPARAYQLLQRLVSEVSETVLIAYVGRSNAAGPAIAGNTHVPVIAVPASLDKFPEDVWSSLRMPSEVPLMTILEPSNALKAAMQILARNNPRAHAHLRYDLEKRLVNFVA